MNEIIPNLVVSNGKIDRIIHWINCESPAVESITIKNPTADVFTHLQRHIEELPDGQEFEIITKQSDSGHTYVAIERKK